MVAWESKFSSPFIALDRFRTVDELVNVARRQYGWDPEVCDFPHLGNQMVQRKLIDAGHRIYLFADIPAMGDKNGIYEIAGAQASLLRQSANCGGLPQPA